MTSRSSRVAVDTCILINVLTGGAGEDPSRLVHARWVLEQAIKGETTLFLPAMVLPELAGNSAVRDTALARPERERRLAKVVSWIHNARFTVIELDDRNARAAARLAEEHQLKPADASILACALGARVGQLLTWDGKLLALDPVVEGLSITEPLMTGPQTLEASVTAP